MPVVRILAIDVGTGNTVAVLADDDAPIRTLTFTDGSIVTDKLPSAVFLSASGTFSVGAEAIRMGLDAPDAFEKNPLARIGESEIRLGSRSLPVRDLIAALMIPVVAQARRELDGDWPDEVRLIHPAGWAAARTGVLVAALRRTRYEGPVVLVAEPIGAVTRFAGLPGHRIPAGAAVGVLLVGAGGGAGGMADGGPGGGGASVRAAVVVRDPTGHVHDPAGHLRIAGHEDVALDPTDPTDPTDLTDLTIADAAVELLGRVIADAGFRPADLDSVAFAGSTDAHGRISTRMGGRLGIVPTLLPDTETAVVLGAVVAALDETDTPGTDSPQIDRVDELESVDPDDDPTMRRRPGQSIPEGISVADTRTSAPRPPDASQARLPHPAQPATPAGRTRRRRTGLLVAVAAVVVAALVTTILLVAGRNSGPPPSGADPAPVTTIARATESEASTSTSTSGTTPATSSSASVQPPAPDDGVGTSPITVPGIPIPDQSGSATGSAGVTPSGAAQTTVLGPAGQPGGTGISIGPIPGRYQVGVLLPNTSEGRWTVLDAPTLAKDFQAAGLSVVIANAGGSAVTMLAQAKAILASGIRMLVVASIDDASGRAVEKLAQAKNVAVVDYDHVVAGGHALAVVTADSRATGQQIAKGLQSCLGRGQKRIAFVGGPSSDPAAGAMIAGAHQILDGLPGYSSAGQAAANAWSAPAGAVAFDRIYSAANGQIDGVLVTDDRLASGVAEVVAARHLTVAVSGQGASIEGLQRLLTDQQCVSTFRDPAEEALAVAHFVAAQLLGTGPAPDPAGSPVVDSTGRTVFGVFVTPKIVSKADLPRLVASGFVDRDALCAELADQCRAAGIR